MTRARINLLLLAVAAVLLAAAPGASATAPPSRATFRSETAKGIANAHRYWWDSRHNWYDTYINDSRKYPMATVWGIVPLFEAVDARAIDSPTAKNKQAVKSFASGAERYWNGDVKPHGAYTPYPGDRNTSEQIWFDDNGWWGIAFMDAYRATGNRRYVTDAARALDFIANRGWARDGGLWWETFHTHKSGEALASGTALAAMLYSATGKASYLKTARKFITWADKHFVGRDGLYGRTSTDRSPMGYVEGPMIGAHEIICHRAHDASACARAESLAETSLGRFGSSVNQGPQFDTIYLRWMLELYRADHDRRWYDLAYDNAARALRKSRDSRGLFMRAWDGGSITSHQAKSGQLQTHAATVALFAWLAAAPAPQG